MIGRTDVIISSSLSAQANLEAGARLLACLWHGSLFEDAETATVYHQLHIVPFAKIRELFVYRDPAACKSWEELGADEANANTMVHLLCYEPHRMTVVVDDSANPEMLGYLAALRSALQAPHHSRAAS